MDEARAVSVAIVVLSALVLPMPFPQGEVLFVLASGVAPQYLSQTVHLPGDWKKVDVQVPLVYTKASQLPAIDVKVITPELGSLGPTFPELVTQGNTTIWRWPGSFGYVDGLGNSTSLVADNLTVAADLMLPSATIDSATLSVQSLRANLTGNYSLGLTLDGLQVFQRNGSIGYLAPSILPWASTGTGSLATATTVAMEPNGSQVLAVGDADGVVRFFDFYPGMEGNVIANVTIEASAPVTTMTSGDIFGQGLPTILAASGQEVYLGTLSATGQLQSTALQISWNRSSPDYPVVKGIGSTSVPGSAPTLMALTNLGSLQTSEWRVNGLGLGWENPMVPIAQLNYLPTCFSTTSNSSTGDLTVATGGLGTLQIFNYSGGSLTLVSNDSIAQGDYPTASAFLGSTLLVGTSTGTVIAYRSPNYSVGTQVFAPEGSAVTSLTPINPSSGGSAVLAFADGTLDYVQGLSGNNANGIKIGTTPTLGEVGELSTGPIFGNGEEDLLIPGDPNLLASLSESFFNATTIGNWSVDLEDALSHTTPMRDRYGNLLTSIPLHFTASGGSARLANAFVDYNYSQSLDLTSTQQASLISLENGTDEITLIFESETSGYLQVALEVSQPSAGQSSFFQTLQSLLSPYWVPLAVLLVAGGTVLFSVGFLGYRKHARFRTRRPTSTMRRNPDAVHRNQGGVR